ncbi:MAG: DegV family protein, partial [Acidobacteriota bacterium]|nr:DegV family protein [Acidobacteriota bacterium]
YVGWDGERTPELGMGGFAPFYQRLHDQATLPTTSQPSIGDFLAVWEPLLEDGLDVVSIHLSSGISGTCDAARQARDLLAGRELDSRVEVLDSESGCGGMGLLLLAAASAAEREADRADVVAHVQRARQDLEMWFCIDTLEYLRRGGRIGSAQAWLGSTLQVKPILTLGHEITPVERVRTSKRAFERLLSHAQDLADRGLTGWAAQHIQATTEVERLAERGQEIFGRPPLFVSEVGPVIGTYTGPGMLGVGAIDLALAT